MVKAGECYFETATKWYYIIEDVNDRDAFVSIYDSEGRRLNSEYFCDSRGYILFNVDYINSLVSSKVLVLADKDSLDSLLRVLI